MPSEMTSLIRKAAGFQEAVYRAFGDNAPMPEPIRKALQVDDAPVFTGGMPQNLSPKEISAFFDDTADAAIEQATQAYSPPKPKRPIYVPQTAGVTNDEVSRRNALRSSVLQARMQATAEQPTYQTPAPRADVSYTTEPPSAPLEGANPLAARWR